MQTFLLRSKSVLLAPLAVASLVMVITTGCSTSPEEEILKMEAEQRQQAEQDRDETSKNIPAWFIGPTSEYEGVLGRGTGMSNNLQAAVDKANFNARVDLASNLRNEISAQIRSNMLSSGFSDEDRETLQKTADSYIPQVDVGGARVVKQEMFPEKGGFRVYSLLYLKDGDRHMQYAAEMALKQAHAELMQRNAQYRQERRQDAAVLMQPPVPPPTPAYGNPAMPAYEAREYPREATRQPRQ